MSVMRTGIVLMGWGLTCCARVGNSSAPPPPLANAQPSLALDEAEAPVDEAAQGEERPASNLKASDTESASQSSAEASERQTRQKFAEKIPKKPLKYEVSDFSPGVSGPLSLLIEVIADAPSSQNPNSSRCLGELHLKLLRGAMAPDGVSIKDVNVEGDVVCYPADVSLLRCRAFRSFPRECSPRCFYLTQLTRLPLLAGPHEGVSEDSSDTTPLGWP